MMLSLLGNSDLQIPITAVLVMSIVLILLLVWAIFTIIIRYHWKNYGTGGVEIFTMNFLYLLGSIVLIVLMIGSALLYFFSAT